MCRDVGYERGAPCRLAWTRSTAAGLTPRACVRLRVWRCAGDRYLFGTPQGLFQLEEDNKMTRVIKSTRFYQISVLEEYGVLMALCGRHRHIRMYKLDDIFGEGRQSGAFRKDPFIKLKNTKFCAHYSIAHVRGTTFLVAAVKTTVILFMWAEFPFNQFMKIKDFYVPEPALSVEAVVSTDGKMSQLAVQCPSRFVIINVETNEPVALEFSVIKKQSTPLGMQPVNDTEILMSYTRTPHAACGGAPFAWGAYAHRPARVVVCASPLVVAGNGIILDMTTLQPKRVLLNWRFIPVATGTRPRPR